ncbi:MAG: glycosyltransferase [Eubacterium sp.]|nr:glycosyltransferase [Eubacterium sp.]
MDKKVGIVIPSLNQGAYIEEALRSVIANKKHTDIELVVMDGGSQDETLSIIKKYEAHISLWHSEPDGGQAAAVNKGIRALGGCRYLMWLNADDVYEDEYAVKKIADFAERNGYDVCYGLSHFIDAHGKITGEYPVEPFCRTALGNRCYLSQPSVLFSRRAYEQTGALNETLRMCLDYEYWIRLAQTYAFGMIKEYIGATRMYAQTKTATMQTVHVEEAISVLQRYYGSVPMHWAVTKVLANHPQGLLQLVPRRLLILLLYPWKAKILKDSRMGKKDA